MCDTLLKIAKQRKRLTIIKNMYNTNPKTSDKRAFPVYDTCDGSHDTMLFYLEKAIRKVSYIDKQQISKNSQDVEKYKVFLPKAYGVGDKS